MTHSLYTDDTLLFGTSSMSEAKVIRKMLEDYCLVSGQMINAIKSSILFQNTSPQIIRRILPILNFKQDHLPS